MKLIWKKENKTKWIDFSAPGWKLIVTILLILVLAIFTSIGIVKTVDAGLDNYLVERNHIEQYYEGVYK